MQAFLFFIQLFMTCSCVEISNSFLFFIPFLPSEIMGKKADAKAKTAAAVKKAAIKANQSKTKKAKKMNLRMLKMWMAKGWCPEMTWPP